MDWQKITGIASQLKQKGMENLDPLFLMGKLYFRDLLLFSESNGSVDIIFSNQIQRIQQIVNSHPNAEWHNCIDYIEETQNYIQRNGYLPLMMTSLLIDIQNSLQGEIQTEFQLLDWLAS